MRTCASFPISISGDSTARLLGDLGLAETPVDRVVMESSSAQELRGDE